jgi:hypothetical protein
MKLDCGPFIPARISEWAYWIVEREAMRRRKARGEVYGMAYSDDPAMAFTRYCNVRRMDDKVSRWLVDYWYPTPEEAVEWPRRLLVVSALLARTINRVETLTAITGGKRFTAWNPDRFGKVMHGIKDRGDPVFTGVYIINAAAGGDKINLVLRSMDRCYTTKPFLFLDTDSMRLTAENLCALEGIGGFMSGQVVADLRWVLPGKGNWRDRMHWAPPGPGSSKGMRYLLGLLSPNEMDGRGKDLTEKQFLTYLPKLMQIAKTHPTVGQVFAERKLEAHDIQNTLCELSKYIRVKNGGRGKNPYPPKEK